MNRLTRLLIPALFGAALMAPLCAEAQHRGSSRSAQTTRTSGQRHGESRPSAPRRDSSTRPGGSSTRPGGNSVGDRDKHRYKGDVPVKNTGNSFRHEGAAAKPNHSARPGNSGHDNRPGNDNRPGHNGNATRPGHNNRPGHNGHATRPGHDNRPGHNGGATRPGNDTRPGHNGNATRPGNDNRPGHNGHATRPGHDNRPGHNGGATRPGHDNRPGYRPGGNSAPRPGSWSHHSRPHYKYRRPGYRPPRPGGGYWGPPVASPYRINYWVPPVPRYVRVLPAVPSIGTILGLTFGSFIDAGINSLFNAGYTVTGYLNNAIYLSNVRQLGYVWPEAMVMYTDGLMSGTQFYNWSAMRDQSMYYNLYNQLTALYGNPVDVNYSGTGPSATWWGGGNTGYITLSYGYGASATGMNNYYTSLTYTAY